MNMFRNMCCFLGAIALVLCIGVIVWYALTYCRRPKMEQGGTLVIENHVEQVACTRESLVTV